MKNGHKSLAEVIVEASQSTPKNCGYWLQSLICAIREHLNMELVFISQFKDEHRELRYVDSERVFAGVAPGAKASLEETYCKAVINGLIPEINGNVDMSNLPLDRNITNAIKVGSYVSVPIKFRDGSVYGMLCSVGVAANKSLNERDLNIMRILAGMAADQIELELTENRHQEELRKRIRTVMDMDQFSIVYQPIYDITGDKEVIMGYEALSRFTAEPKQAPNVWFAEAAKAGLGPELEMAAISKALQVIERLPKDLFISVNASPLNLGTDGFNWVIKDDLLGKVVLEVTEHEVIQDYSRVLSACQALRNRGVRIAVDDVGAGWSTLSHLLNLRPDIIKLDRDLISGIDKDENRQVLVKLFVTYGKETSSRIVAEGVETAAELETLKSLGVEKAQGYLLGKPAEFPD